MLVVGLTGGIGSGKSTVAELFARLQVPIIDADDTARELTSPAKAPFAAIVEHFGKGILKDQHINRRELRRIIFSDPKERLWLESLLHPLIREAIEKKIKEISAPYCIVVVPLLFEVKPYDFINRILVVDAPEALQISRVNYRDKVDEVFIATILRTQVKRNYRLANADDVIMNDSSLQHLESQVATLHDKYLTLAARTK
jgi:dephospho-CoA kinase